jgi:flagellar motor switch protein FliN/FliY
MMSDDLMTQEELDALLSEHHNKNDFPALNTDDYISVMEQDTLAEIGNISMGSAATALSALVNHKVRITVPKVYVSTAAAVAESYPIPCIVVNVAYMQGLQGANVLVMREEDALVIGNLMMGQDGTSVPDALDELYLSAVTEAMNMMMGSAATAMSELFARQIDISPPDTSRRDLSQDSLTNEIPVEEPIVVVAFRMEIEDLVDSTLLQIIEIDFAREMVRALMPEPDDAPAVEEAAAMTDWADLKKEPVQAAAPPRPQPGPASLTGPPADQYDLGNINIDLIKDIPVQVRAILGRTKMSIDNILRLGPGHIMELESLHGEPIDLYANDTLIARGEVVVVGEQFGVRITEIATPKDRIVSIR